MTDWIESIRHLYSAEGIAAIVSTGGVLALIGIIFAETGLLVGFFFPGDSLLITAGVLSNPANLNHIEVLNIWTLNLLLAAAGMIGDQTGYFLGRKTGDSIWRRPDSRFFKKKHLTAAHEFYEKYGGFSVVAARYVPIIRTFVPFAAGMARMPYTRFVGWNIFGGFLWVTSLLWVGYYLGQTSLANRLDKIIIMVIFVSILPMVVGVIKRKCSSLVSK